MNGVEDHVADDVGPGGPQRFRLIAILVAGLLVVGGGVFLLRDQLDAERAAWANPNPQQEFQAEEIGYRAVREPSRPERLEIDSLRSNTLRVRWGAALAGESDPDAATAYELYWAGDGRTERLVLNSNATELTGLADDARYSLELRSINALGQRSEAIRATAVPSRSRVDHLDGWSLIEDFDEPNLDAQVWQLHTDRCVPQWVEGGSITADARCWWTSIRSRAPLSLDSTDDGARGRVVLLAETPAAPPPDPQAEALATGTGSAEPPSISLDLTPLPAITDGAPVSGTETGTDSELPPESVRLVVDAEGPTLLVGPGLLDDGQAQEYRLPAPPIGMPTQWELRVNSTDLTVLRDGVVMIRLPAEIGWQTADVTLTNLRGNEPHDGGQAMVDLIAIDRLDPAAATDRFPLELAEQGVQSLRSPHSSRLLRTPVRAEIAMSGTEDGAPVLDLAGQQIEVQPVERSAEGQRLWTAELAVESLSDPPAEIVLAESSDGGARMTAAALRLWSEPDERLAPIALPTAETMPSRVELGREIGALPTPTPTFALSQDGRELEPVYSWSEPTDATGVPRGELGVTVTFDDGPGLLNELMDSYGMTGWELRADDEVLLRVPAHPDGPMVGGEHHFTVDTSGFPAGEVEFQLWIHGLEPGSIEDTHRSFVVQFTE